jgi:hypothetical protein
MQVLMPDGIAIDGGIVMRGDRARRDTIGGEHAAQALIDRQGGRANDRMEPAAQQRNHLVMPQAVAVVHKAVIDKFARAHRQPSAGCGAANAGSMPKALLIPSRFPP